MSKSPLEQMRLQTPHLIPPLLQDTLSLGFTDHTPPICTKEIASLFPHLSQLPRLHAISHTKRQKQPIKVGAVFSGGPAAGGHNVLAGIFDSLEGGQLIGFLGGPSGIIKGHYQNVERESIDQYRNLGGFDLLGSGRTKIETKEHLQQALTTCSQLQLDGLVIIGGDDSNTNAALLAEFFHSQECSTKVIGVPKTIDGDLRNLFVPISFGFDTACKVYAELIGNICKDAKSAGKYTHFIRLMGRSASHITLECALTTHPNYTLIAEEVHYKQQTLHAIVSDLCDVIEMRSKAGKEYGVILVPEGLIEFIPEIASLIQELNVILNKVDPPSSYALIAGLSPKAKKCFESLPEKIQSQLLLRRDPHGNVQVSHIETEKLLAELVGRELNQRSFTGSFHPMTHFFGYEGRCALPSPFDAAYCYALGVGSALLIQNGASGYMTYLSNLHDPIDKWELGGIPLASFMHIENRKGANKPVIKKSLVSLDSSSFHTLVQKRSQWAIEDDYCAPGPMQFTSDCVLPISVLIDQHKENNRGA